MPAAGARLGRDPTLEVTFPEDDNVVSAVHARVWPKDDGTWWLEDLGSTNGTWLNGKRLAAPQRLRTGDRFTLGQRGPGVGVSVPGEIARTQAEPPIDVSQPVLRLRRVKGGEDLIGMGDEIVLGRAAGSTIPLRTVADTVVSKHHAMVEVDAAGNGTISDLGSKNGTWVNGTQIQGRAMLKVGDRLMLGWHGPLFEVRILGPAMMPDDAGATYHPELQPAKTLVGMVQVAQDQARDASGLRPGVFLRALARQMARESSLTFRVVTLALLAGLIVAVSYLYGVSERRAAEAQARLATAERALANELRSATQAQQHSQEEIDRLRRDLASARRAAVSRAVLDSLSRRLREAEARAAHPQAIGGVDFTRIARENQRAIALVISRFAADSQMGSGFVITPSGYLVTNRHVVLSAGRTPRSVEVIMADTNVALAADVVRVSDAEDTDIAILKIRGYTGPAVRAIDWAGRGVQQGAPAAMLGFPGGPQLAIDRSGYVRTSMFAGIISRSGELLQFGGTTYAGVSGSPIFNANGEVIAVHFGALREGLGLGFSVPIARVRRWLPPEARAELGI